MGYPIRENTSEHYYLVTNRCLGSQFLMRPSDEVNQIFAEWLVRACQYYQVELYAFINMSSHYHLALRCPEANLDAFVRYFQTLLARFLNDHWKREDSTVFPRRYSAEPILDDDALIDRVLYILLNPVKAGLVDKVEDWPGLSSAPENLRNERRVFPVFYRTAWHQAGRPPDCSPFQKSLPLQIAVPPAWRHLSPRERARRLRDLVTALEEEHRKARKEKGRNVLGVRAILHAKPTDRPRKIDHRPRPLCHTSSRARWEEYRRERARFLDAYREASDDYRAGRRGARFPRGSFPPWLRQVA